jgi:ribosomal protein S18 acetylase RimI-like enzyme
MADNSSENWPIERLKANHDRTAFRCGIPSLDEFVRKLASQYERKHMGRTYVALEPDGDVVRGYYTISAGAVAFATVPPAVRKKLPRHPIPVVHLGRLAVDATAQGRGLGEILLLDAMNRSARAAEELGVFAIEVFAINDAARRFYLKYGFEPLVDDVYHLYLPMRIVLETVK